jgi:UbiD family decarboxylase
MAYYKELREQVKALDEAGKLVRVKREINKDTELHPLVRLQFRGLPDKDRKAFLFENVTDAKGRKYKGSVLVGSHAASKDVYAIGLKCGPEEIPAKWANARKTHIPPVIVERGPVQEEVHSGANILEHGGLDEFPIPISTPGFDNAPYLTAGNWISRDPENGIRNVGNYRGMIKSPTRIGILNVPSKDLRTMWEKCRKMGKPLEAAIAIGPVPAIGYCATVRFPYEVDEMAVAGGLAGEPMELVRCKSINLEVPATAEIVFEGELPTDGMEREGPFGEFTGFMASEEIGPYFNVKCITHRKNPIYNSFISQFPPSESTTLRSIGQEASLTRYLRQETGVPVVEVALHESASSFPFIVVSIKKTHPSQAWQALNGVVASFPATKFVIVVDDDIDPRNANSVNWAMSWRVQPDRDIRIVKGMIAELDPSLVPPSEHRTAYPMPSGASAVLIDATMKWDYPPVSLPKREFMEKALRIWEEEGLPALSMTKPWFGYDLGFWTKEFSEEAELALKGEHYVTGEKLAKNRVKP